MSVVSNGVQTNKRHKDEELPSFRPSIEETLRAACLLIMMMKVTISPRWQRGVWLWWLELLDCDVSLLEASPSLLYTRMGLELPLGRLQFRFYLG